MIMKKAAHELQIVKKFAEEQKVEIVVLKE